MKKELKSLKVLLWGREVGELYWDSRSRRSSFSYSPSFMRDGWNISPLYAPVGTPDTVRVMWGITDPKIYHGLPPFIADSLPDDWGNLVLSLGENRDGISFRNPLERLSYIGMRGMGALEFKPVYHGSGHDGIVNLRELQQLADRIFRERQDIRFSSEDKDAREQLLRIGTPPGGRQAKAVFAMNEDGEIRSGQVPAGAGFRYYILKFQPETHPKSANIEQTYYEMATAAGICMMPSRLYRRYGEDMFLTERFDRNQETGEKILTQTLAAIFPSAETQEDVMNVAGRLGLPYAEREEVFRRIVFNFMGCNTDDHVKNISFMMGRDGVWHLAPAYDITYTIDPYTVNIDNGSHCMPLCGKWKDVTEEDLIAFAGKNDIKAPERIINSVAEALLTFRERAAANRVSLGWIDRIEGNIAKNLPERFASRIEKMGKENFWLDFSLKR